MKTIRISAEVWDAIAKRGKFGEKPNDVLERVFKINKDANQKAIPYKVKKKRGTLPPHGTKCRFDYKDKHFIGEIINTELVIPNTGVYSSFSNASSELTNTSRNGWLDWEINLPGESRWLLADTWRKTY